MAWADESFVADRFAASQPEQGASAGYFDGDLPVGKRPQHASCVGQLDRHVCQVNPISWELGNLWDSCDAQLRPSTRGVYRQFRCRRIGKRLQ